MILTYTSENLVYSSEELNHSKEVDELRARLTDPPSAKILRAFELLRMLDREMPGQCVSTFLYVASHEGCHKQAIEDELALSTAASSRNTDLLSTGRIGNRRSGLELISKEYDPMNRRRQIMRLTPKGKQVINQMKLCLYDNLPTAETDQKTV